MTDYGGKELAAGFRTVRANTIQIAEDIPESNHDFRAAPDCGSERMLGLVPHLTRQFQARMAQAQQAQQ